MKPYMWAILTAITWGIVPIVEKFGLEKISPVVGLFYRCFGVIVGITLLLIFQWKGISESFSQLHPGMLYLVLGGFLASVVGQIFFYHSLKTGEASRVVPIGATYPLVTFILAVIFLHEKFTWVKSLGLALILAGGILLR